MGVFAQPVAIDISAVPKDGAPLAKADEKNAAGLLLDFLRSQVESVRGSKHGRGYTHRQIATWFGDQIVLNAIPSTSASSLAIARLTYLGLLDRSGRHHFLGGVAWSAAPGDDGQKVLRVTEPAIEVERRSRKTQLFPRAKTRRTSFHGLCIYGPPGCKDSRGKEYRAHSQYCRNHGECTWDAFVLARPCWGK